MSAPSTGTARLDSASATGAVSHVSTSARLKSGPALLRKTVLAVSTLAVATLGMAGTLSAQDAPRILHVSQSTENRPPFFETVESCDPPPTWLVASGLQYLNERLCSQIDAERSLRGLDILIANELTTVGGYDGVSFHLSHESFDDIAFSVETDAIDVAISKLSITTDRAARVHYSQPYFQAETAMLVPFARYPPELSWQDITSTSACRVGLLGGTSFVEIGENLFPDATRSAEYVSLDALFDAFQNNSVDAIYYDRLMLEARYNRSVALRSTSRLVVISEYSDALAIAVDPGQAELLTHANVVVSLPTVQMVSRAISETPRSELLSLQPTGPAGTVQGLHEATEPAVGLSSAWLLLLLAGALVFLIAVPARTRQRATRAKKEAQDTLSTLESEKRSLASTLKKLSPLIGAIVGAAAALVLNALGDAAAPTATGLPQLSGGLGTIYFELVAVALLPIIAADIFIGTTRTSTSEDRTRIDFLRGLTLGPALGASIGAVGGIVCIWLAGQEFQTSILSASELAPQPMNSALASLRPPFDASLLITVIVFALLLGKSWNLKPEPSFDALDAAKRLRNTSRNLVATMLKALPAGIALSTFGFVSTHIHDGLLATAGTVIFAVAISMFALVIVQGAITSWVLRRGFLGVLKRLSAPLIVGMLSASSVVAIEEASRAAGELAEGRRSSASVAVFTTLGRQGYPLLFAVIGATLLAADGDLDLWETLVLLVGASLAGAFANGPPAAVAPLAAIAFGVLGVNTELLLTFLIVASVPLDHLASGVHSSGAAMSAIAFTHYEEIEHDDKPETLETSVPSA